MYTIGLFIKHNIIQKNHPHLTYSSLNTLVYMVFSTHLDYHLVCQLGLVNPRDAGASVGGCEVDHHVPIIYEHVSIK